MSWRSDLLGPRPRRGRRPRQAGADVDSARCAPRDPGGLVPEFLINTENLLSAAAPGATSTQTVPFNDVNTYFCVPENDSSSAIGTVESRLYKIRHCMNIDGQVRRWRCSPAAGRARLIAGCGGRRRGAALMPAPRSDPGLSLRGAAWPRPGGRRDVSRLGAQVLVALERRDGEALALLRNVQEMVLLDLTTEISKQIKAVKSASGGRQPRSPAPRRATSTTTAWCRKACARPRWRTWRC